MYWAFLDAAISHNPWHQFFISSRSTDHVTCVLAWLGSLVRVQYWWGCVCNIGAVLLYLRAHGAQKQSIHISLLSHDSASGVRCLYGHEISLLETSTCSSQYVHLIAIKPGYCVHWTLLGPCTLCHCVSQPCIVISIHHQDVNTYTKIEVLRLGLKRKKKRNEIRADQWYHGLLQFKHRRHKSSSKCYSEQSDRSYRNKSDITSNNGWLNIAEDNKEI